MHGHVCTDDMWGLVQFLRADEPMEEEAAPAAEVHDDLVCVPALAQAMCAVVHAVMYGQQRLEPAVVA